MMGAIAPGLSIELVISFESNNAGEFRDMVTIVSEPFINMGFIQVGKERKEIINFRNEGSVDMRVDLNVPEPCELKILPNTSFMLKSNEEVEIELVYNPTEPGIFRGLIEVITDGQCFMK